MPRLKFHFFMLFICLSFVAPAQLVNAAKFYKWTDESGSTHYSDKAPDNVESAETVHISSKKIPAANNEASAVNQFQSNSEQQKEASAEELAEQEKQEKALAEYCQSIQSNIKALEIGGRIQTVDAEGNKKFLDENEQKQKLDGYLQQQKENCN